MSFCNAVAAFIKFVSTSSIADSSLGAPKKAEPKIRLIWLSK